MSVQRWELVDCYPCGQPWREIEKAPNGEWVEFVEYESLRAELLAARRELARARARAMSGQAIYWLAARESTMRWNDFWCERAARLCEHYARKFEREAEEVGR